MEEINRRLRGLTLAEEEVSNKALPRFKSLDSHDRSILAPLRREEEKRGTIMVQDQRNSYTFLTGINDSQESIKAKGKVLQ